MSVALRLPLHWWIRDVKVRRRGETRRHLTTQLQHAGIACRVPACGKGSAPGYTRAAQRPVGSTKDALDTAA
jgi:hypothetical protein